MAKRRRSRSRYRYTAKRRAALKRAQIISARKRKGKGLSTKKKVVIGAGVGVAGLVAAHHISGSSLSIKTRQNNISKVDGRQIVKGVKVTTGKKTILDVGRGDTRFQAKYVFGKAFKPKMTKYEKTLAAKPLVQVAQRKDAADAFSHVSNVGKAYYADMLHTDVTAEGAPNRDITWGTYPLSDAHVERKEAYYSAFEKKWRSLFARAAKHGI